MTFAYLEWPGLHHLGLKSMIKTSMEKEMATHSSILAWKSPWIEESDGLKSMGLHD